MKLNIWCDTDKAQPIGDWGTSWRRGKGMVIKMRKGWWTGLLLAAVLCGMTGCGKKEVESVENKAAVESGTPLYSWGEHQGETLTVWGMYPDLERTYIKKAFARYEELTGNHLSLVQLDQKEFAARVEGAFNGEEEAPDILISYGGTNVEAYDPDENFYDFSDAPWVEDLTDTSINQTIYNGKVIGLPHWEASISGTLYNKKIFERYGLKIPDTQEEFLEVCAALLENGITPVYLPGKEVSMLLYQFPLDCILEGEGVLEGLNNGSLTYSDLPQLTTVVEWYKTMAQEGYFGESFATDDWNGMNEAMSSGKYAMMLCWDTWLYTDYTGDPEEFGLMPAFIGVPEKGTFEGPNLSLFIVNRHSKKVEAAVECITFLADPYNYNAAFEGIYTAPVFKNQVASISTAQYLEAERLIEQNFRDSCAWLRIHGFSQMDASCILAYMSSESVMSAGDCLLEMDRLRAKRLEK